MPETGGEGRCELCGRVVTPLTRHHLIPRGTHHNRRVRRQFSREAMQHRILRVCAPCHRQIHRVASEKELALRYNTRESLLGHPALKRFVDWVARRPSGVRPHGLPRRRRG